MSPRPFRLDLGCGQRPRPGCIGVERPALPRAPGSVVEVHVNEYVDWIQPRLVPVWIEEQLGKGFEPEVLRIAFDLATGEPWPFRDGSVDGLESHHCIEHLPANDVLVYSEEFSLSPRRQVDALAFFMEQAWRVTRPDGLFRLTWPSPVDERSGLPSWAVFRDPTHRRFIPKQTMFYFNREGRRIYEVEQYGYECNWVIQSGVQRACGDVVDYDFTLARKD